MANCKKDFLLPDGFTEILMSSDTLFKLQQKLGKYPLSNPNLQSDILLGGMKVRVVDSRITQIPKLKIAADVPMTDQGRADMNRWLEETFGYSEIAWTIQGDVVKPYNVARLIL